MKKSFIFGLFAAALALVSCNSTDGVDTSRQDGMSLNFFAMPPVEANSRAALTEDSNKDLNFSYSANDKVKVTNSEISGSETPFYEFTFGADSKFTSKDAKATKEPATWTAYFPSDEVSLANQSGKLEDLAKYYLLVGTQESVTGADGLDIKMNAQCAVLKIENEKGSIDINVKTSQANYVTGISADGQAKTSETSTSILKVDNIGTYYIVVPAGVQLAIKNGSDKIKATGAAGLTAGCYYDLKIENVINVTSVTLDKETAGVEVDGTVTLIATVAPENATNKELEWTSSDANKATVDQTGKVTGIAAGTVTITATAKDGSGKSATCTVTVKAVTTGTAKRTGNIDVNWVQLWENGPKFAVYNVGAANNKPEDYGGYYCWGKSADKAYNNYKDGTDDLTGDDDTAIKLWGTKWRMPTQQELQDLCNESNCTKEWTTVNGKSGWKFTGKGAYASNSVFLPAGGQCTDVNYVGFAGRGFYWSSTHDGSDNAQRLYFTSDNAVVNAGARRCGYSVRAVLVE